jgi:hypothetical protein
MKITKKIHKGWEEWLRFVNKKDQVVQDFLQKYPHKAGYFGKWQYIYESEKGMISLIKLLNYDFMTGKDVWEIYELSANKLFEDVKRFRTKKEAEKRIRELLG